MASRLDADAAQRMARHLFGAQQEETMAWLAPGAQPSEQEGTHREPDAPAPFE